MPSWCSALPAASLTELGQEYARHCRALVAVALEADSMVAERRGKVSGILHLGWASLSTGCT